jgi:hypothetical protein
VLAILGFEPDRLRVTPVRFPFATAAVLLAPMLGHTLTRNSAFLHAERIAIYLFAVLSVVVMTLILERLIATIVSPSTPIAGNLLDRVWIINVLSFGLLYWQLDRGRPLRRSSLSRPERLAILK